MTEFNDRRQYTVRVVQERHANSPQALVSLHAPDGTEIERSVGKSKMESVARHLNAGCDNPRCRTCPDSVRRTRR